MQTCKNKVLGGNGGQRKTSMINDHQVTNNDHRPQHCDGGWMFLVDNQFCPFLLGRMYFHDDTILGLIQVKESPIPGAGEGNFAAQEIFQKDFNINTILILIHLY